VLYGLPLVSQKVGFQGTLVKGIPTYNGTCCLGHVVIAEVASAC
jgi:hypothetical protein